MVKKKIARARKHTLMIILEREGEREKETACVTANERKYIFVNSEETRRNHFVRCEQHQSVVKLVSKIFLCFKCVE